MLTHIHVRNLAIIDEIEVELAAGMTTLTGETGAGKSILVDALGLVLGDRADSGVIRHGCERAEISASFDTGDKTAAGRWLQAQELDMEGECQLRRVISREGRSRAYINGRPVPVQSLREIGDLLVDIHGQHEHQSLLRGPVQRQLLDDFGGHQQLLAEVGTLYNEWKSTQQQLEATRQQDADRDARLDLLRYQSRELAALGLTVEEIGRLDEEHARQANAGRLLGACQQALARLDADDGNSVQALLGQTLDELQELASLDSGLAESTALLNEAAILFQEGVSALRHYGDRLEIDPQRLHWLEERIGVLHDLSRKHRCKPVELPAVEAGINHSLEAIEHGDRQRAELEVRLGELDKAYHLAAGQLTRKRRQAAGTFGRQITTAMQTLGMAGGVFEVSVLPRADTTHSPRGVDAIGFRVSANPGQPVQPLSKVASGGELSRISLSIQVISAGSEAIPTLIFDEVDSGIGGGVAEIVGQKLHTLAGNRQVLCVTHLPQVAAQAHRQLQVSKLAGEDTTRISIRELTTGERVDELARMLGGMKITRQTREHAREMLEQGQQKMPHSSTRRRKAGA
jgi:DNA repair protein RecN (Recombination protein N)